MRRFFAFFCISGFCGLVYETIWVRLSMAQFGVTAASLSIVVSLFMGGLALGSWLVSRNSTWLNRLTALQAARAYALAELAIALLGLLVPPLMRGGGAWLTTALSGRGDGAWYVGALLWQAMVLLPVTAAMGATIPLGMLAISRARLPGQGTSFSYLYLANVLGAVAGAIVPTFFLVEVLGFHDTLLVALVLNLAVAAWAAAPRAVATSREADSSAVEEPAELQKSGANRGVLVLLFFTGLCSLAMEVVWTREFTMLVGTVVYSFASILAIYLGATFAGSAFYRILKRRASPFSAFPWSIVAVLGALPLLAADPSMFGRLPMFELRWSFSVGSLGRVALGIGPFSAALGFLTPQLVDRWSQGRSDRAGLAYAVNTLGCILGPLLAGFILLPWLSPRWALAILCLPLLVAAFALTLRTTQRGLPLAAAVGATVAVAAAVLVTRSLEERYPSAQVQRDHTATTIASGEGPNKKLMVNGIAMTVLTPATKMMAHLTLALLDHVPKRALTICFGMGTTFRSLNTWDIDVTAVELVPGVPQLFSYFHSDAPTVLAKKGAHVIIDDGRRFLEKDASTYDAVIIDPPPPVQAASSSLLYSTEIYSLIKRRLAVGGILQQWIPGGDDPTLIAMIKALKESFPYVQGFHGQFQGMHLFASMQPFKTHTARELAAKLSPAAGSDFIEWGPSPTVEGEFAQVLSHPVLLDQALSAFPNIPALSDDRPVNEYYFLRDLQDRLGTPAPSWRW